MFYEEVIDMAQAFDDLLTASTGQWADDAAISTPSAAQIQSQDS